MKYTTIFILLFSFMKSNGQEKYNYDTSRFHEYFDSIYAVKICTGIFREYPKNPKEYNIVECEDGGYITQDIFCKGKWIRIKDSRSCKGGDYITVKEEQSKKQIRRQKRKEKKELDDLTNGSQVHKRISTVY